MTNEQEFLNYMLQIVKPFAEEADLVSNCVNDIEIARQARFTLAQLRNARQGREVITEKLRELEAKEDHKKTKYEWSVRNFYVGQENFNLVADIESMALADYELVTSFTKPAVDPRLSQIIFIWRRPVQ